MTLQLREQTCKNRANHTPVPEGYIQWDAWATRMSKMHRQIRCPECGLWAIWVKEGEEDTRPLD